MSNDVTIPDLKRGPSTVFATAPMERLGDGIEGSGFSLIGVKGKEFYLRHKGKRYTLVNPPSDPPTQYDGMPAGYFDFVILRKGDRRAHTFYRNGYESGREDRPTCVSTDGIAPDDNSLEKQANLCDLCPQHEWKKQPNGRDGRACSDSLRLAVLPMPAQMKALLGEPINEPCLFRIPAASLTALSELGDLMVKRFGPDTRYSSFITRVTFKQGVEWPQFEYRVIDFLEDDAARWVMELRETPTAYRIMGLTPEGKSLVRRGEMVQVGQVGQQQIELQRPVEQANVVDRLAAERAERMAAVRRAEPPLTIEAKAEEVTPQVPLDDRPQQKAAPQHTPVPDSSADIDALVSQMRPRPPGA